MSDTGVPNLVADVANLEARVARLELERARIAVEWEGPNGARARVGRHPDGAVGLRVWDAGGVLVVDDTTPGGA